MKIISGLNALSAGSHSLVTASRNFSPPERLGRPTLHHVGALGFFAAEWIQAFFKDGAHQHPVIALKMSSVPLPWCTSKSITATRCSPCTFRAWRMPTHVVEKQSPAGHRIRMVSGRAHAANAVETSPRITKSVACTAARQRSAALMV